MSKKNGKKIVIAAVIVVVLAAVFAGLYLNFAPKASAGAKEVTVEVVDNEGAVTTYEVDTDAEYLRQVLDEADGLTYGGTESEYGMMIDTVNGLTADYSVDGSYWAIYVDGEYANYGVDEQPVEDGQTYRLEYTTGM